MGHYRLATTLATLLIAVSSGYVFQSEEKTKDVTKDWNALLVQFPSKHNFPLDECDALRNGWILLQDDCAGENVDSPFVGKRYVLGNDQAAILIFDSTGKVAGIQFSYVHDGSRGVQGIDKPRLLYKDRTYVTAYFTDIVNICHHSERPAGSLGDKLILLTGTARYLEIALKERNVGNDWIIGKCFPGMGQHYWYKELENADCDELFPVFLLYSKEGELNGFGFTFLDYFESKVVEHATVGVLSMFMHEVPKCFKDVTRITSMHVFLSSDKDKVSC